MSGLNAMVTVLEHAPYHWTSGMRLCAIALAQHVDGDGFCWPSVRRISERTGLSQRQVIRYMAQLEAEGVVTKHRRSGTSNWYRWLWTTALVQQSSSDIHVTPHVTPMSPPPLTSTSPR